MAQPTALPHVLQIAAPAINHYGYFAIAALVLLEDFGVPVPGETTLIAAAVFAGLGKLNILVVIITGIIAAVIGDNIGFAIGDFGGRSLLLRYGKYIFLTKEKLDKTEKFFNEHGPKVIVIARFVEGLRQLNGIFAGISDMKWLNFIKFNLIGATLWVCFWSSIGYFGGNHINTFLKYQTYFTVIVLVLIVCLVLYKVFNKFLRNRKLN